MKRVLFLFILIFSLLNGNKGPLKVGFVYVTPIGDAGWSYQHNLGRLQAQKYFADRVQTKYFERIPEGPASQRVIRKLASSGYDLIFATSFGYMNPVLNVAKSYPNVVFEHATGYKTSKNVGNFAPKFYEGRYLAGMLAGAKSKSNIIGYVAAFPIPEVVRGINAFTLGAKSVNKKVKVKVIWTNDWFNPSKESQSANSLISQGADVLTHHTASVAIVKVANDKGKYAIAYHSDMSKYGKKAQIGIVEHRWGDFYIKKINQVLNGTWKSSSLWYGLKQGLVDFKITTKIDSKLRENIEARKEDIISGKFNIFSGEIYTQDGVLKVKKGDKLSDKELLSMDYFVQGVDGQMPKK